MRLLTFLTLGWLASSVNADLYLQYPRGANNRLDEANRDRNNGNRLYDTQNNNRGGVNAGNHRDRQYFYEGSIMPVSWTVQHGCGSSIGSCQMILQYMCDPEARDGINKNDGNPAVTNADEPERGRHESKEYYARCLYRQRNKGLFTADQDMNNRNAAIYTRQDNQGTRYAFECPEERDYYPYWEPTPWIDVAILTSNTERCPAYQAESQNVKGRWSCNVEITENRKLRQGFVPITKEGCEDPSVGGTWTYYPPHNAINPSIRAPECKPTQATRDNHHGNPNGERYSAHYNWTIPATYGDSCVFRIRYNITTGDFPYGGFDSWTTLGAGIDSESNQDKDAPDNENIGYFEPTKYDIWTRYGFNFSDIAASFRRPQPATKVQVTANELLSRGYVFKGQNNDQATPTPRYPQVDIFGTLVPARQPLQLALDSSQFGRTFQDRTHVFSIRQRLPQHQGLKIYNVGVRGRRGNIVQCYPSTEYDFVPERLQVTVGDLVHFQWMGSDNAGNNAGQAPNDKDRSNIVVMRKHQYREYGADNAHGIAQFTNETGHLGQYYPGLINDTREYPFLGFGFNDLQQLALQGLNFSYFDLGPRQVTRAGVYHYIGTRNSAFSNRNQVATIVVLPSTSSDDPFASSAAATSYNDAARTWTDNGWLYMGDYNTDGAMTGAQLQMIDMGSDGDSHIHLVLPKLFTVGPGQDVIVNIKHKKVGLNIGRMYWRAETTDEWLELSGYSDQGDYTEYHVTANSPVSGGYYKVVNGPNGPAIAGVVIGILIFFALCVAIYWKVRVQPAGGWSIWWATVRPRRSSATSPTKKLDAYKTDSSTAKSIQLESPSQPTLPTPAPKPVYTPNPAITTNTPYQMPHMAHSRV